MEMLTEEVSQAGFRINPDPSLSIPDHESFLLGSFQRAEGLPSWKRKTQRGPMASPADMKGRGWLSLGFRSGHPADHLSDHGK